MKTSNTFKIKTPKNTMMQYATPKASTSVKLDWDNNLGDRISNVLNKSQQFIDSECLRLNDRRVPKDMGTAKQSGIRNTVIGSGQLKYVALYIRRIYYIPMHFQGAPMRGNYFFEKMKQQYRTQILNGAKRIVSEL